MAYDYIAFGVLIMDFIHNLSIVICQYIMWLFMGDIYEKSNRNAYISELLGDGIWVVVVSTGFLWEITYEWYLWEIEWACLCEVNWGVLLYMSGG